MHMKSRKCSDGMPVIAFLLVVHTNPRQCNCFIRQLLQYPQSYVYIHIDAKSTNIAKEIVTDERVLILPEHYDIKWGDYTQILVNNYLMRYASGIRHHDYYSLHSGADLMIRSADDFARFLSQTNCYAFCDCVPLPSGWQYGGGLGRLALNWPTCFRKRLSSHSPLRYLRSLYGKLYGAKIIKGKKLPKKYKFYGGADWFTISGDCANELLEFIDREPEFQELFIRSLSGAEIYYVTLFEMLKADRPIEDKNLLRFIDWKPRGQKLSVGSPNTCTMSFLDEIEDSGCFFARKFNSEIDSEIIDYFLKKTGVCDCELGIL